MGIEGGGHSLNKKKRINLKVKEDVKNKKGINSKIKERIKKKRALKFKIINIFALGLALISNKAKEKFVLSMMRKLRVIFLLKKRFFGRYLIRKVFYCLVASYWCFSSVLEGFLREKE